MVATAEHPAVKPIDGRWDPTDWVTVADVPTFAEHSTKAKSGKMLRFGQRELQQVADRCNRRIYETGDYAVICIQHTRTPEEIQAGVSRDPTVVGVAGPFKVGRIGQAGGRAKYAILADYHYYNDPQTLALVRRHPRRSPELWITGDGYDQMFLDPIALLGAEVPRLDMGMFYSAQFGNAVVEKYQAAAPERYEGAAAPAAGNCFVPSHGTNQKRYDLHSTLVEETQPMALSPDDIQALVQAFSQLDWVQWCQAKMQEEAGNNSSVLNNAASAAESPSVDVPQPAGSPPGAPAGGPAAPLPAENKAEDEAVPGDDDLPEVEGRDEDDVEAYAAWRRKWRKKKYAAESPADKAADPASPADDKTPTATVPVKEDESPSRYQRPVTPAAAPEQYALQQQVANLQAQVERYSRELESERATRIDADRYSQLLALRQQFAFDLSKTYEQVRYGRMSDEQFAAFAGPDGIVQNNFQRIPVGAVLPTFDGRDQGIPAPGANGQPEQYSAEASQAAFEYCRKKQVLGESVDYAEVLKRIKAGEKLA